MDKEVPLNDTELFIKAKQGDNQAFSELFRKYYPKDLNIIYRFLPNRDEAEDIAQEVFLRAYRAAKAFVPKSKFSTWLYRITVNCCLSHYKRLRREHARLVSETDFQTDDNEPSIIDNAPSPRTSPAELLLEKETQEEIQSALDRLPRDQKMALILLEYGGLSYKEIADKLDKSADAVRKLVSRAMAELTVAFRGTYGRIT